MKLDVPLVVVGAVVGVAAFAAFIDTPAGRVDRAQAAFEASPEGRGYNWPVFHQPNSIAKLRCRDVSTVLRVCDVATPTIDPRTGENDGWAHQPFACNTATCGWLTE